MNIEKTTTIESKGTVSAVPTTRSINKVKSLVRGAVFASALTTAGAALAGPEISTTHTADAQPVYALDNPTETILFYSNLADNSIRLSQSTDNYSSSDLLQGYIYDTAAGFVSIAVCPQNQTCHEKRAIFVSDNTNSNYGNNVVACSNISSDYKTVSGCSPLPYSGGIAFGFGFGFSPDFNYLIVGDGSSDTIKKMDLTTGVMTSTSCPNGGPLAGAVLGTTGNYYLYMGSTATGTLGRIHWNESTNTCDGTFEPISASNGWNNTVNASGLYAGAISDKKGTAFYLDSALNLKYAEKTCLTEGETFCTPACGDTICNGTETTATCPTDCPDTGTGGTGGAGGSTGGNAGAETGGTSTGGTAGTGGSTGGSAGSSTGGSTGGTAGTGGVANICGDGITAGTETCDNAAANGTECVAAYGSSCTYCDDTCNTQTVLGANCGDGIKNGPELCDTTDLNSQTCATLGAGTSGTITCTDTCTFDASTCSNPPTCGDGTCEASENCLDCASDCGACAADCAVQVTAGSTCEVDCLDPQEPTITFHPGLCQGTLTDGTTIPAELSFNNMPEGTQISFVADTTNPVKYNLEIANGFEEISINDGDYEMGLAGPGIFLGVEGTRYDVKRVMESIYLFSVQEASVVLTNRSTNEALAFDLGDGPGRVVAGKSVTVNILTGEVIADAPGTGGTSGTGGSATGGSLNEAGAAGQAVVTPTRTSSAKDSKGCSCAVPGENGNTNGALGALGLAAAVIAMRSGKKRKQ